MLFTRTFYCGLLSTFLATAGWCQQLQPGVFSLMIINEKTQPAEGATIKLLRDSKAVKTEAANSAGIAKFENITAGDYTFSVSYTGYRTLISKVYHFPSKQGIDTLKLLPLTTSLSQVEVTSQAKAVEVQKGKVILNVDASVTNAGTTVLEVLEKSPGITVDRNGGIALQGKTGVLVTIDDKPTYLSGADLNNLLSSMSSNQVAQIELIANPTARYDASGNAGIINIKTKKNKLKGFNGSVSTAFGQGVYTKNNNSLVLNFRTGNLNTFLNYSNAINHYLTDLYALRTYYDDNNNVTALLKQPSYFKGVAVNNTIKTGLDYNITPKTTIGFVVTGMFIHRDGNNESTASWMQPSGAVDSAIFTGNNNTGSFHNGAINVNLRQETGQSQTIAADFDYLHYTIGSDQDFTNHLLTPNGYTEQTRSHIPTSIKIKSGKADYTLKADKNSTIEGGFKFSSSSTDNFAAYQNLLGGQWIADNTRSNHFIYDENINAAYTSFERKIGKVSIQSGVRYEHTTYHAHQLGNAIQKDSAFSRNYGQFFPSGYISYQADTANSFTFAASRRIDRPVFQSLNPFYFIINKYTYQTGNAYLLPQYSWNLELAHQYKDLLTTTVSYSNIKNYFSQLFLADTAKGILLYSQGNVGSTYTAGLSTALSISPVKWWSVIAQATYTYKRLKGFNGNNYTSNINQLNLNASNQFHIGKTYTAEISGFYTTKARNDVQELLYPTGQLSVGVARPVLKNKATLRFSARDLFYTNAMEGFTSFPNATEYFIIHRDSRVCTLSFTYRFGKVYKTKKRSDGSATEEMERVGTGG